MRSMPVCSTNHLSLYICVHLRSASRSLRLLLIPILKLFEGDFLDRFIVLRW